MERRFQEGTAFGASFGDEQHPERDRSLLQVDAVRMSSATTLQYGSRLDPSVRFPRERTTRKLCNFFRAIAQRAKSQRRSRYGTVGLLSIVVKYIVDENRTRV